MSTYLEINSLLNNPWIKEENTREISKHSQQNENKNKTL